MREFNKVCRSVILWLFNNLVCLRQNVCQSNFDLSEAIVSRLRENSGVVGWCDGAG